MFNNRLVYIFDLFEPIILTFLYNNSNIKSEFEQTDTIDQ